MFAYIYFIIDGVSTDIFSCALYKPENIYMHLSLPLFSLYRLYWKKNNLINTTAMRIITSLCHANQISS